MADAARIWVYGEREGMWGTRGRGYSPGVPSIPAGEFTGTTASIFGRRDWDTGVPVVPGAKRRACERGTRGCLWCRGLSGGRVRAGCVAYRTHGPWLWEWARF